MRLRPSLKFLHTIASAGMVGALAGYMILLVHAPQASPADYADMRQSIEALCTYLLGPSMAVTLVSGLLAIAFHMPFQEKRWVWVKAALGLAVFEATLHLSGSKANYAAELANKIAEGAAPENALEQAIASEWGVLYALSALTVANIALGVWRPSLTRRINRPSNAKS